MKSISVSRGLGPLLGEAGMSKGGDKIVGCFVLIVLVWPKMAISYCHGFTYNHGLVQITVGSCARPANK